MEGWRQSFSAHKWYFIGFTSVLLLTLIPQLLLSQNELFLLVNGFNSAFFDTFFLYLTYFGDGITFLIIILTLVFVSYSKALTGLVVFLSTSIFAQILKNLFFDDHSRPYKVLSEQFTLHIPGGVTPLFNNSFPSGHTVTTFAMATFLVLTFTKRNIWLPLLLLAWLTAFSRIYLTHHFPIDVWVGSMIGTYGTLLIYLLVADKFAGRFGDKALLNR